MQTVSIPFDLELPPVTVLSAGDLTCMYECGNLRTIRWGDTELVRMIYGAVRNREWGTASYQIKDETIVAYESSFFIRYTAYYKLDEIEYKADFSIEGHEDNTIIFEMKGEALSTFEANRIGLCMHHPLKECSNRPVRITRPNREEYTGIFPQSVSPFQPLKDIVQMEWVTANDLNVTLEFDGEIFETEDHRNWSDSSYKTYCRPLELPYPFDVKEADKIKQSIVVKVSGAAVEDEPALEIREEKISFPALGYCRSAEQEKLTDEEVELFKKISFQHYRVAVDLAQPGWQQVLSIAFEEASLLDTSIELIVFVSDNYTAEIVSLLSVVKQQARLGSLLLYQKGLPVTPPSILAYAYPLVNKNLPSAKIGYGSDLFFTELNRARPGDASFDFISFAVHPQVHAFDTRSILENLESQADIMKTAIGFSKGKPVHVSPLTFKDRFSKHCGGEVNEQHLSVSGADTRQYSHVAAFWTLMAIQQFGDAESITLYELFGEQGLIKNINGEKELSPLYNLLVTIKKFKPASIIRRYANNELMTDDLLLENENGERLLFMLEVL